MSPIERLLAEAEITRLVTQSAALSDAGDFAALATMFTEDGVYQRPSGGDPIVGRAQILASYKARPPRLARHVVANVLVDVVSADEARCRSTLLLYTGEPGEQPAKAAAPALLGGFEDRLVRQDGKWLFAERRGWVDLKIAP
jgi:ketosteroid isomerase-like protein